MSDDVRVGSMVVTEDDRTFKKTFEDRGSFTIRLPLPFERVHIMSSMVRTLNGAPTSSLSVFDQEYLRKVITLNVVTTETPEGWKGADQCPDDALLSSLWAWYMKCEAEFEEKLKKNQFTRAVGGTPVRRREVSHKDRVAEREAAGGGEEG
jgi:hypothetical protein